MLARSGSWRSTTMPSCARGSLGCGRSIGHDFSRASLEWAEAIQQFRTHRPDITLMDLQMPEMNGVDAMIAIRGEFPEARIIVLTTYTGDVQVLRALKAGARAYLLKNLLHKELLETIRAVHAGKKTVSLSCRFNLRSMPPMMR